MNLIDSHCHLNYSPLCDDLDSVLHRAHHNNVNHVLSVCTDLDEFPALIQQAEEHKEISISVGQHPNEKLDQVINYDYLYNLARNDAVVAIGETGLDYFHQGKSDSGAQRENFLTHIAVAEALNKPLIIHTRDAMHDMLDLLDGHRGKIKAVMHCFTGDHEDARQLLDMGHYISFSGILTFKSATKMVEAARYVSEDQLLIETDAPYLAPVPFRGKPNEPAFVRHTAEFMAKVRNCELERIATQTTENFQSLFKQANTDYMYA